MRSRASVALPPSKLRERRKQARTMRFVVLGVLAVMLLGGGIGFFHIPAFAVRDVRVEGASTVPVDAIERSVREELSGHYFFVVPKKNAFLYSDARIEARLAQAFPKLQDVEVSLANFHTVEVSVRERAPHALFCGTTSNESQTPCLFIDQEGVAYEAAPEFSDNAYVRFFGIKTLTPGEQYLTVDSFRPLGALVGAMKEENLSPARVEVDAVGDVLLVDVSGMAVRFTMKAKPEEILKSLRAALSSEALGGKTLAEIEYIDLRFGNRLYYKVR